MIKVLISNDDGVHAPGIQTLFLEMKKKWDVTVVAPLEEKSTTGHSLSLDRPLRVREISPQVFGCSGFPADCVLVGLGHLCKTSRPDLVVSGINRGANLAQDLYYSGTIAAAREAAFHDLPAIAVSLVCSFLDTHEEKTMHFASAARYTAKLIELGIHKLIPRRTVLNINVPDLPWEKIRSAELTTLGFRHYSEDIEVRIDTRGRKYYWVAGHYNGHEETQGTDCAAITGQKIAVNVLDLFGTYGGQSFPEVARVVEAAWS